MLLIQQMLDTDVVLNTVLDPRDTELQLGKDPAVLEHTFQWEKTNNKWVRDLSDGEVVGAVWSIISGILKITWVAYLD